MTAILTNAPLETKKSTPLPFINKTCGSCTKCVEVCPAGAISQDGNIDRQKCAQYMFDYLADCGEDSVLRSVLCDRILTENV